MRHSVEDAERRSEELSNLRHDLTVRKDTSGDKFRIELEGKTFDNRGVAGELLLRQAHKIRKNFGSSQQVGKFAGFNLYLRPTYSGEVDLVLKGKNQYTARVTDTAQGTIRSLESEVQGFEDFAKRLESKISDSQKLAKELEGKVGVPFEHEERFHQLAERQSEIEEKLDLTKNQAPSQVDDVADDENEEKIAPRQTQKKSKQPAKKAAAIRV